MSNFEKMTHKEIKREIEEYIRIYATRGRTIEIDELKWKTKDVIDIVYGYFSDNIKRFRTNKKEQDEIRNKSDKSK